MLVGSDELNNVIVPPMSGIIKRSVAILVLDIWWTRVELKLVTYSSELATPVYCSTELVLNNTVCSLDLHCQQNAHIRETFLKVKGQMGHFLKRSILYGYVS